MATPILKTIPLTDLKVSRLNMRHGRKAPDISDILPSVRASGIRQPLLVRPEGKGFGIVAGRRRFFALKAIARETGQALRVPCAIMDESDDASAIEASLIENIARLPATEMEQYNAFERLHGEGRSVEEIAVHFGVTETKVRRVLALAALNEGIRDLYAQDELDVATVRALTLGSAGQQAQWLRLYHDADDHAPMGRACRDWITGGRAITTDKALFDLSTYDGAITADLFGEHGVFADTDTFWRHQSAAVSKVMADYRASGWCDVEVLERGRYFARWDHEPRSKARGGRVFIEIRHDGTVTCHEGYITRTEARRAETTAKGDGEAASAKPDMTGPLSDYILLHRHGAASAALLSGPGVALRLAVAHMMVGSTLWDVHPHAPGTRKESTLESLAGSKAASTLQAARDAAAETLTTAGYACTTRRNGDAHGLCALFAALLKLEDEAVLSLLALAMAETLEAGTSTVEAVLHVCDVDLSENWTPEPAFFELLRDKSVINALLADIATDTLAASMATDTGKAQKLAICNRIIGEGCAASPDWRPGWMQVPPRPVAQGRPSAPAEAWARVSALFEATGTGRG